MHIHGTGPKLIDGLKEYGEIIAKQQGKTLKQLEDEVRKDIEINGVKAKYEGQYGARSTQSVVRAEQS